MIDPIDSTVGENNLSLTAIEVLMKYVLDTSVILSGKDIHLSDQMFIPPSITDEIQKGGRWYKKFQRYQAAGLRIVTPPGTVIEMIKKQAKKTGDFLRLSEADIEVLALAYHLNAVILTDDYTIQNLARSLNIGYKGVAQKEIEKEYRWAYRCKKCKRWFDEPVEECFICGGEVSTVKMESDDR